MIDVSFVKEIEIFFVIEYFFFLLNFNYRVVFLDCNSGDFLKFIDVFLVYEVYFYDEIE